MNAAPRLGLGLAAALSLVVACPAAPADARPKSKKAPPTKAEVAREAFVRAAAGVFVAAEDGDPLAAKATEVLGANRDRGPAWLARSFASIPVDAPVWARLRRWLPESEPAVVAAWWKRVRPAVGSGGFDHDRLRTTASVGGGGGGPFREDACGLLVGVRWTQVVWAGHPIVRSLQPLFRDGDRLVEGKVVGIPNGCPDTVLAPPGHAIGGLFVRGGHRVDGFAPVFLKIKGRRLDREFAALGAWCGGTGGGGPVLLGGEGHAIVGIGGRSSADVDALHLVESLPFEDRPE